MAEGGKTNIKYSGLRLNGVLFVQERCEEVRNWVGQ